MHTGFIVGTNFSSKTGFIMLKGAQVLNTKPR